MTRNLGDRVHNVGDRVLVLLPIPGEPLRAKFCGPKQLTRKSVMYTTLYYNRWEKNQDNAACEHVEGLSC